MTNYHRDALDRIREPGEHDIRTDSARAIVLNAHDLRIEAEQAARARVQNALRLNRPVTPTEAPSTTSTPSAAPSTTSGAARNRARYAAAHRHKTEE